MFEGLTLVVVKCKVHKLGFNPKIQVKTLHITFKEMSFPHGVGVKHCHCNPRVSGSILCTGNLKKLFIWMKIHRFTQNS